MRTALSTRERRQAITAILEARFSVSAFEQQRREDPEYWRSARNDMGRGIYGQAMRVKEHLVAASDEKLQAELFDIALARRQAA